MQKNILIAIFAVLTMVILAIFVLLLDMEDIPFNIPNYTPKTTLDEKKKTETTYKSFNKNYYLPVDVLYVKIDLEKNSKLEDENKSIKVDAPTRKAFQLIVNRSDRYSLFCIKQTLGMFSLPYIVVNENGKSAIIVDSNDRDSLNKVAKKLEQYEIKSEIKRLDI